MKTTSLSVLCAAALMFLALQPVSAGLRGKVGSGNSYFKKQQYDKSLEKYREALIDDPESKPLHFNLGDALYKQESYEEALKEFEKATYSKDILLQAKSYYNMGNCLYQAGKLPESIQFYKKALDLDPKDEDAKYNIDFVQKKIKENMEKKPQEKQQQQQQQQKGQSKQDKDKKQEGKQDKKEEQQAQQAKDKKKSMSKEDAERILQAFDQNEKDAQKKRKMQAPAGASGPAW